VATSRNIMKLVDYRKSNILIKYYNTMCLSKEAKMLKPLHQ
jgi:hypothetical protein